VLIFSGHGSASKTATSHMRGRCKPFE